MVVKLQTHYYNNRRKNQPFIYSAFLIQTAFSEYSSQKLEVLYRIINSEGILELECHHFISYNDIMKSLLVKRFMEETYNGYMPMLTILA